MKAILRATHLLALSTTVAVLAALLSAPAGAQGGTPQIRLEATGTATASLDLGGGVVFAGLPVNTEHPYGWSGNGRFTITVAAGGSCRIVADGAVVAQAAGPGAACVWP